MNYNDREYVARQDDPKEILRRNADYRYNNNLIFRKQLLEIVKDCNYTTEVKNGFTNMLVRSACIVPSKKITDFKVIEKSRRWSCIDISYNFGFSCTCIDTKLATIFGLDCGTERVAMVPQHRVNTETFVDFYLYFKMHLDDKAVLTTFDKWAAEKKNTE